MSAPAALGGLNRARRAADGLGAPPAGHCLDRRAHASARLERSIRVLDERADGGPLWPGRRERLVRAFRDQIAVADARGAARLWERLRVAIERHSRGDPQWLERYIGLTLRAYTEPALAWPYAAFEAAVLLGLRCQATGRLLPVRP